jgi:hypothetical protein
VATRLRSERAHPEYDADIKAAGIIQVLDEVKHAIYSHRSSAAIVHHLAKNKALVEELNNAEDVQEVLFKVGEIAASIRAEEEARKKNAEAAGQRPLRFTNRSSLNGGAKSDTSKEERFQRFHK